MTTHHPHRLLRAILRMDRAGSAYFIGITLACAPALVLVDALNSLMWLLWVALIVFAVWLAVLGVCMAWGLTVSAARGDDLPDLWWESMIGVRGKHMP